jgi:hypothetical protein
MYKEQLTKQNANAMIKINEVMVITPSRGYGKATPNKLDKDRVCRSARIHCPFGWMKICCHKPSR